MLSWLDQSDIVRRKRLWPGFPPRGLSGHTRSTYCTDAPTPMVAVEEGREIRISSSWQVGCHPLSFPLDCCVGVSVHLSPVKPNFAVIDRSSVTTPCLNKVHTKTRSNLEQKLALVAPTRFEAIIQFFTQAAAESSNQIVDASQSLNCSLSIYFSGPICAKFI